MYWAGVEPNPLLLRPLIGLVYQLWMIDDRRAVGETNDWEWKPKYQEKTYSSAVLSTTDLTLLDLVSNLGRRGEKPVTNRRSCGTGVL
jgi:hypothetical protein